MTREGSIPQEAGEFLNIGREPISLLSSPRAIKNNQELQAWNSHLWPWERDRATNPRNLSKLIKDRKMPGSSQNGFKKRKSHLTNTTIFQNMATSSVGEGGAVDVVSFAFIQLLTPVALQRKTLGNLWTLS